MKTTVVPAQITTVEDRIAGNFTFAQIFLLIVALIFGTIVYVLVPPAMHLGSIKMVLIIFQFIVFGGLAIRINGKIVAEWLTVYSRYTKRPRRYVFTKNDETGRDNFVTVKKPVVVPSETLPKPKVAPIDIPLSDQSRVDHMLTNPSLTLSFELAKKGGIDVSIAPVKE